LNLQKDAPFKLGLELIFDYDMERCPSIVTLTTDFGTSDGYVGAMKGIMLGINPHLNLIDVSHDVQPFDIVGAAFLLKQSLRHFPENTVHLVVVDPGVGSIRQAIAIQHEGYYYVGPDNGLFTLLLETDTPEQIVKLIKTDSAPISMTFHGRDLFAPVAAHLASGLPFEQCGYRLTHLYPLEWQPPKCNANEIIGHVVHIDHFGNCITNISRDLIEQYSDQKTVLFSMGNTVIQGIHSTYSDVSEGEMLMLFGSTNNFLEIAICLGNASTHLDLQRSSPIHLQLSP